MSFALPPHPQKSPRHSSAGDLAAWSPPTAEQVAAHLAAHRPVLPPASRRLIPLIPLGVAAVLALAIGGAAWVLPWLSLVGTSFWARTQLARRQRQQRRVERARELVRLRFNRPALRTVWRLLPELTDYPGLHHAAVSVLARGLEQTLEADAALTCLDHLTDAMPKAHPARTALDARKIAGLVASGRLADADAALRRLRSAGATTPEQQAVLALAELDHAVATAHYHEAIEESPALVTTLRPLGLGAARGYALRALCHHHRNAPDDPAAARGWWQRATALIDGSTLVAALPVTQPLAHAIADASTQSASATEQANPETPPAIGPLPAPVVKATDQAPDDTTPSAPPFPFTPQRLRRELAADRWLRRGVLWGLPAGVLAVGLLTAWPLAVATLSAVVVFMAGGGALLLLQAPVVAGLPALAPLTESAPPAAEALLNRLTARRGLGVSLRRALYHGAATLAHRRGAAGDQAAAAALARELLRDGPIPDTSSPAAAVATSPPYAGLLLIAAEAGLAADRPADAYFALVELARTAVTLDQGLQRLALQTRYHAVVGDDAAALTDARGTADLGGLMPTSTCRRLHRDLLTAAERAGDAEATAWLAERVKLLG